MVQFAHTTQDIISSFFRNVLISHIYLLMAATEDINRDFDLFVANLKIFKLPKLILRLASLAHQLNPAYENILTSHNVEYQAMMLVNKGCYDYRDEITCHFHRRVRKFCNHFH